VNHRRPRVLRSRPRMWNDLLATIQNASSLHRSYLMNSSARPTTVTCIIALTHCVTFSSRATVSLCFVQRPSSYFVRIPGYAASVNVRDNNNRLIIK